MRYKDYYYDAETGWYQTGSRFYDPEVGRFLNADDLSLITETVLMLLIRIFMPTVTAILSCGKMMGENVGIFLPVLWLVLQSALLLSLLVIK